MTKIPCFIIIIFICIFITDCFSQINLSYHNYTVNNKQSLHSNSGNNLSNFPIQFGFEFGSALPLKEKKYFYNGYWLYAQLNLYSKRLFIKAEYGNLKMNEELNGNASYLFFGCQIR